MHRVQTSRQARGPLFTIALAATAALAACQSGDQAGSETDAQPASASAVHGEAPADTAQATEVEVGYACADDKSFTIALAGQDEILITIDGEKHTLARETSHAGFLFTNDDIMLYTQGREASVEIGGEPVFTDCEAQGHPQ
jgi:membrane-bound inhibitor of C-type lysozyme